MSFGCMIALPLSMKLVVAGLLSGIFSFVVLFVGLGLGGGGHGSYSVWYAGLLLAAIATLLLLTGCVIGAVRANERKTLPWAAAVVAAFGIVGLKFFAIAEWLSEILYS